MTNEYNSEPDAYLAKLRELATEYSEIQKQAEMIRRKLDGYIVHLREAGYSYPVLAKNSKFAQGTIQNIVAKADGW